MNADPACVGGWTLAELIRQQAGRRPNAVVIVAPGRPDLTYGELDRHLAATATALNALGIGRNDRVALVLPPGPEMAMAFLGIAGCATGAPLDPDYRAGEFAARLAGLGCRAVLVPAGSTSPAVTVAEAQGIPVLELVARTGWGAGLSALRWRDPASGARAAPGPASRALLAGFAQPDDVALVLHTSGTAGPPKRVPLTHRNLLASALAIRDAVDLDGDDRCLNVMPIFHVHGLSTLFASLAGGGSVVCAGPFSAADFFACLDEFRPTWYTAAPTIHREILAGATGHPASVARHGLRFVRSASAPMPRQLLVEIERVFGVPFIEAYGMTEAGPQIASNRLGRTVRKPGSVVVVPPSPNSSKSAVCSPCVFLL